MIEVEFVYFMLLIVEVGFVLILCGVIGVVIVVVCEFRFVFIILFVDVVV